MRKESSEVKSHDQDHIANWASYPSLFNPESLSFFHSGSVSVQEDKRENEQKNE